LEEKRARTARARLFRGRRNSRVASGSLGSADELRLRRRGPREPLRDDRGRRAPARARFRQARAMKTARVILAGLVFAGNAVPQTYPAKPVRFIVGPGPDALARVIGQKLSAAWGQPVIIDQRGGGGGTISAEAAAARLRISRPSSSRPWLA